MMMSKFGKMGSNKAVNDLGARLDDVLERRAALEKKLFQAQDKLSDINQKTDPTGYDKALAAVMGLKQQVAEISTEHVDVAHAFTIAAGGKIHRPPPV